jgi:hypothetical protein
MCLCDDYLLSSVYGALQPAPALLLWKKQTANAPVELLAKRERIKLLYEAARIVRREDRCGSLCLPILLV